MTIEKKIEMKIAYVRSIAEECDLHNLTYYVEQVQYMMDTYMGTDFEADMLEKTNDSLDRTIHQLNQCN